MYFATDIANFLACPHLTALNRQYAWGTIKKPFFDDPGLELLIRLGEEHEQKYLDGLKASGRRVVEITAEGSWARAAALTREAMVGGADVIYQATLFAPEGAQCGRDARGPSEEVDADGGDEGQPKSGPVEADGQG